MSGVVTAVAGSTCCRGNASARRARPESTSGRRPCATAPDRFRRSSARRPARSTARSTRRARPRLPMAGRRRWCAVCGQRPYPAGLQIASRRGRWLASLPAVWLLVDASTWTSAIHSRAMAGRSWAAMAAFDRALASRIRRWSAESWAATGPPKIIAARTMATKDDRRVGIGTMMPRRFQRVIERHRVPRLWSRGTTPRMRR